MGNSLSGQTGRKPARTLQEHPTRVLEDSPKTRRKLLLFLASEPALQKNRTVNARLNANRYAEVLDFMWQILIGTQDRQYISAKTCFALRNMIIFQILH
jgi:hypothetical protein